MMNKLLCLLFSVFLLVGLLAGCDKTPSEPTSSDAPPTVSTDATTVPSVDEADGTTGSNTTTSEVVTTTTTAVVKSVAATTQKSFEALPAEKSVLLNKNPDRGYRSELIVDLPAVGDKEAYDRWTYEEVSKHVSRELYRNALNESFTVSRLYFYLAEYSKEEALDEAAIQLIRHYMKAHMEIGVKMYVVFYYQRPDTVCPDAEIIMKHMDQIKDLLHEFETGISAMCFGLIGRYGEWTSAPHVTAEDRQAIANKMLTILPENMYLVMRQPTYKWSFIPKDHPKYKMIGFADDACFGMDGTHSETWLPGTQVWNDAMKEAAYAFNDGELFTTNYFRTNGVYVKGLSVVESLSQHRTSTFSIWHGYGDYASVGGTLQESTYYGWKCEEVTIEWLNEKGLPYSPGWFTNIKGKTLQRNVFEYLRDYLGYRFSMTDLQVTGGTKAGKTINIAADIVNYGMASGHNLKSGFAILDENGNMLSEVEVGNPADWHSTDPTNYANRELLKHSLKTSMTLPGQTGTYKLAFFMRNAMGQYARLDNTVPYENGYNILHMFTID